MNALEHTVSKAFTRDSDYNEFFGRPKRVIRYDWYIRQYRWMVVCEPKTPKDRIKAANPNATMKHEKLPANKRNLAGEAGNKVRISNLERAHRALQLKVIEYLCEHGMTSVLHLAHYLEIEQFKVQAHLNRYKDTVYCSKAVDKRKSIWGVIGVHDREAA